MVKEERKDRKKGERRGDVMGKDSSADQRNIQTFWFISSSKNTEFYNFLEFFQKGHLKAIYSLHGPRCCNITLVDYKKVPVRNFPAVTLSNRAAKPSGLESNPRAHEIAAAFYLTCLLAWANIGIYFSINFSKGQKSVYWLYQFYGWKS